MKFRKILTVDDSELVTQIYRMALSRLSRDGMILVEATNGREALDRLEEHPDIDLIFLDLNMPVMTGSEFLQILKADPVLADIPVVIVSTIDSESETVKALKEGATAYLTKPFNAGELRQLMEQL